MSEKAYRGDGGWRMRDIRPYTLSRGNVSPGMPPREAAAAGFSCGPHGGPPAGSVAHGTCPTQHFAIQHVSVQWLACAQGPSLATLGGLLCLSVIAPAKRCLCSWTGCEVAR